MPNPAKHKKVLTKINSFSTQGRFLIHPSVTPSFINSVSIHQATTMYQVLGEAYTLSALLLYNLTWATQRLYSELIFCLHAAVWLYQFLVFLCFLVLQASSVFPCQLTSPASRPPPWTHADSAETPGRCPSTMAQAVMGEQLVLYQLTSIFNNTPGFAAPYFSFGPQIQHCSLIHHLD